MAIYKPTDCSPFNGVFDVTDENALPIYLECKIDSANTPVSAYRIEVYNSENTKVFPTNDETVENAVTMVSDLKKYTDGESFNIKTPTNTGYNGTYLKIPFVVKSVSTDAGSTVARNQVAAGNTLKNGGKYYWAITLYQEISKDTDGKITLPNQSKYYDMPVVSGQVIGSNASRLQTELIPKEVNDYQTLNDLVLIDRFVQLYDSSGNQLGVRTLVSSFDSLYGHIIPSNTSINTITDDMVNASSYLKVFKAGNDPSNLGTTDKVDIFYGGKIPESGAKDLNGATWTWVTSYAEAGESYWKEEISYGADAKPTSPYLPFGSGGPQISGSERLIFNGCIEKQYNGIFYPSDISVDEVKKTETIDGKTTETITGYTLTILWNRTTDADNWGNLSNKIVYISGVTYGVSGTGYAGKNVQIDAYQQFGTINKTPFNFVLEKPVKLRANTNKVATEEIGVTVDSDDKITVKYGIATILSVTIGTEMLSSSNYVFEQGSSNIRLYKDSGSFSGSSATVSYYTYDENEYKTNVFKNELPTVTTEDSEPKVTKNGKLYIRPSTSIAKDMIFKELTSSIYSRWFKILDFNTDFYYVTYGLVYRYVEGTSGTGDEFAGVENLKFDIGQRYQIKSYFKTSDYNPFALYKAPDIDIVLKLIGRDAVVEKNDDTGIYEIKRRNISATATYEQDDYIWWESYQWILYAMNDRWQKTEILQQTEETYTGEIECEFYGLIGKKENGRNSRYYLTLIVKTNVGAVIEKNLVLEASFGEVQFEDKMVESKFDCDLLAVDMDIATSTNIVVPSFSQDCVFDKPPEETETFDPETKTYVINPNNETEPITKLNTSNQAQTYSETQTTMCLKGETGHISGFQSYGKSAFVINDGVENKNTTVENTSFDEIDVVENDMIVETQITINKDGTTGATKEYSGNIFSIKDEEEGNKISLFVPDPITEDGLVERDRNKFVWKHTGAASLNLVAKNRTNEEISNYWQNSANNKYATVSIYQSTDFTRVDNTNLEDIKYINDDGTENNYGKNYGDKGIGKFVNMKALFADGSEVVGLSTYGENALPVHEVFTKQSAFNNEEKYTTPFECTAAGVGSIASLVIRGKYASMFNTNDTPAKPYEGTKGEDGYSDQTYEVVIGESSNGSISTAYKSVLLDADSRIYFYNKYDKTKPFLFYSGQYCTGTVKKVVGAVSVNNRVVSTKSMEEGADSVTMSGTGLQKIKKYDRINPERQQLNNTTITIKADVGVGMEVDEITQGYWIGGGSN